jgi:ethanolamine ammonia-lyase large subunit
MPEPAAPTLVPIPLELLERMTRAHEASVEESRAARTASEAALAEARAHHLREEPALRAHEDYVRRLTEEESQAAAAAKAAADTARQREDTARSEARTKTLNLWTRVLIPLLVGLLGGGGLVSAYLGGPGAAP